MAPSTKRMSQSWAVGRPNVQQAAQGRDKWLQKPVPCVLVAPSPPDAAAPARRTAPLDEIDAAIVAALRSDGRLSMRALAERLHISRANTYTRVQRLEQEQVITGYSATVDPYRCGYDVAAYVYLKVDQHSWKDLRRRILEFPEVEHGALVSGEHDIVLLVRTRDPAALREFVLNDLQAIPAVLATRTELIFDELPHA
jgi:DNA-binding Lrp family transcriptional regulator